MRNGERKGYGDGEENSCSWELTVRDMRDDI